MTEVHLLEKIEAAARAQKLPLFSAPRLAHRPYCTDDPATGLRIRSCEQALRHSHIQANTPALRFRLVFDIDRPGAIFAAEDANVAPPNWFGENPDNGHAHAGYELEIPIVTSESGRDAPVRYAAAVEYAYRRALGADTAYSGLICKNPTHDRWWTHIHRVQPYDLGELAEWVDLPTKLTPRQAEETHLGRNVRLFDGLRHWAYRNVKHYERRAEWSLACHAKAGELNTFDTPLHVSEVLHVGRSVEKWVWTRFDHTASDKRFSERQAARGQRNSLEAQAEKGRASGKARTAASENKRASAVLMRSRGMTQAAIAAELGVTDRTVRSWLNDRA
ncbi:replication initiation protein [Malikia spinosa]|jgi:hypothetical protein|uniref:Helix-turn-helix domain-containing protein n=1 Tax=Malikia spinosa TaxID=86180 RepID=A0A7C9NDC1_9BURK|nr:replication initiation protein [Malikia spinosa]MYZ54105.1 helix-turn-helix domain-containing protein [Malikia spinosa]